MSARSDRLYEHFQRERSSFHRWLIAVASVGAFFLLVFQPYLSTLSTISELEGTLARQADEIARAEKNIRTVTVGIERAIAFMGDASAYDALYEDTRSWVATLDEVDQLYERQSRRVARLRDAVEQEQLASWPLGEAPRTSLVRRLQKTRPELMEGYDSDDRCFFLVEAEWMRCRIDQKLDPIGKRLFRVLYDRTESHEHTARLEEKITENRKHFRDGLEAAIGRAALGEWVREYLNRERAIIRSWYEQMARERSRSQREEAKQQELMAANRAERETLEQRKGEIAAASRLETPIGTLPLSFHDLIGVVPLVLALTGIPLVRSQQRLIELRRRFQSEAPADEAERDILGLTMPLWLDPSGRWPGYLLALVTLSLPALAALAGLVQLLTNPGMPSGSLMGIAIATGVAVAAHGTAYARLLKAAARAPLAEGPVDVVET